MEGGVHKRNKLKLIVTFYCVGRQCSMTWAAIIDKFCGCILYNKKPMTYAIFLLNRHCGLQWLYVYLTVVACKACLWYGWSKLQYNIQSYFILCCRKIQPIRVQEICCIFNRDSTKPSHNALHCWCRAINFYYVVWNSYGKLSPHILWNIPLLNCSAMTVPQGNSTFFKNLMIVLKNYNLRTTNKVWVVN